MGGEIKYLDETSHGFDHDDGDGPIGKVGEWGEEERRSYEIALSCIKGHQPEQGNQHPLLGRNRRCQ